MSSDRLVFGSVGALSNCKHPSVLAKKLALNQTLESKLVQPNCLVGQGADAFAFECNDVPTCSNSDLITDRSRRFYEKSKIALEQNWDTVTLGSTK